MLAIERLTPGCKPIVGEKPPKKTILGKERLTFGYKPTVVSVQL